MRKLSKKAFLLLFIAIVATIGIYIFDAARAIISVMQLPDFSFLAGMTNYTIYRVLAISGVVVIIHLIWLLALFKDLIKPSKRIYLIVMVGFHISSLFFCTLHICDYVFITRQAMSRVLTIWEIINILLPSIVVGISSLLVFVAYFVQKRFTAKMLARQRGNK